MSSTLAKDHRQPRVRTPRSLVLGAALAACAALTTSASGSPPVGFYTIPSLRPGLPGSSVRAISASGDTAVGIYGGTSGFVGMRWTIAGGEELGNRQSLTCVSDDGSIYAGVNDSGSRQIGYYFSPLTGGVEIGDLPGGIQPQSYLSGLSADGLLAVGGSTTAINRKAIKWTPTEGLQELPSLTSDPSDSYANTVSNDHSLIAGYCEDGDRYRHAVVWHQDGSSYTIQLLDHLLPDFKDSVVHHMSPDGSFLCGFSRIFFGSMAVRWTADGSVRPLGDFPDHLTDKSQAFAISDDGRVVVGEGTDDTGKHAFIWTNGFGMQYLTTALAMAGVGVPAGWDLQRAVAISADGRTIAGDARAPNGVVFGFIAVLPRPPCGGDVNWDGQIDFLDFLSFLNYFSGGDLAIDYTHDGIVDYADYLEFLNVYAAGCPN